MNILSNSYFLHIFDDRHYILLKKTEDPKFFPYSAKKIDLDFKGANSDTIWLVFFRRESWKSRGWCNLKIDRNLFFIKTTATIFFGRILIVLTTATTYLMIVTTLSKVSKNFDVGKQISWWSLKVVFFILNSMKI